MAISRTLTLWFVILLLRTPPLPCHAAVCSIDLGSEWLKISVVNLKPGHIPISIAINEMSKRKTPALIAFHSGDRLIGEEAAGLVARYPERVYSRSRDMLGKPLEYSKLLLDSLYLPFTVVEDQRGVAASKIGEDDTVYTAEGTLAMLLKHSMEMAESHAKVRVGDAVVMVPPYFGQAERKAVAVAAEIAGMNLLGLANEHVGAALQYGIDKDFSNGSRNVVFFDMGGSSTYAALVYFSAYPAKEYGKPISANQFQVKDVRWDAKLGGQDMELRLVEYFADEVNKQIGDGIDVRSSPKSMAKLKKQVKRTKEILSANTAAPISIESIYEDRDFRSTITREKFEELCEDIWDKALVPIKELLKHSGLKIDDIYSVEVIGGATRVPKLQAKLQEFLGNKALDRHLDADEAVVLGAALLAANLSDGIKLNRKLGMSDGFPYGLTMELTGPEHFKDGNLKQILVPRMKKVPSKMYRSVEYKKDFEVSLAYESKDDLPPGVPSQIFSQYSISGLTETAEKYSSKNLSSPIKANLHFSMSRSGVLSLERADAVIEVSEWVNVSKKVEPIADKQKAEAVADKQNVEVTAENTNNSTEALINDPPNSTFPESEPVELVVEKKLRRRTFRVPLKMTERITGPGAPLSKEAVLEEKRKLELQDKKDAERRRSAELKNSLEGYIYATKEKLESSHELTEVSTAEQRQSFSLKLDEVQDWLYMDGENAKASEFEEHLNLLKENGGPIFFRLNELTARPAASENARGYLVELQKIVRDWETSKPWVPRHRVDEVVKLGEKLMAWLDDMEDKQKKISVSDTPVYTSEEIQGKILNLQDKVENVNRIPKPKPKAEDVTANKTDDDDDDVLIHTTSGSENPDPNPDPNPNPDPDLEEGVHDEL